MNRLAVIVARAALAGGEAKWYQESARLLSRNVLKSWPTVSASDAPTQQAPVSAGKDRLAESDEIEPPPTPRSPMHGGTSQAPQQSEPSSVSSTPAPILVIKLPKPKREGAIHEALDIIWIVFWVALPVLLLMVAVAA